MTSVEAHNGEDGSKFKRFMKRFSRQPSSDGLGDDGLPSSVSSTGLASSSLMTPSAGRNAGRRATSWVQSAEHTDYSKQEDTYVAAPPCTNKYATLNNHSSSRKSAKAQQQQGDGKGKNRRSFFGSSAGGAPSHRTSSAPVLPPIGSGSKPPIVTNKPAPGSPEAVLTLGFDEPVRATNLAGTLKIPRSASQQLADAHGGSTSSPPQLAGLPRHEELLPSDFLLASSSPRLPDWTPSAVTTTNNGLGPKETAASSSERPETGRSEGTSTLAAHVTPIATTTDSSSVIRGNVTTDNPASSSTAVHHISSSPSSPLPDFSPVRRSISPSPRHVDGRRNGSSSSLDDASLGAHTADTGKGSRFSASTKPTTLMSLETRDAGGAPATTTTPMAGIATHRHGDVPPTSAAAASASASASAPTAISFAATTRVASNEMHPSRNASQIQSNEAYVSIPALSRPHPANNPSPSAIPSDNASVLTLASSTARESFYAPSARPAPSLGGGGGGARSIGGSILGDHVDRRNSSDTYASVKALPPLSRRGSDASSRTKDSGVGSLAGREYRERDVAAPGAPGDRISMHRTASQRTVATQLSIPLSTSAAATAASTNSVSGVVNPSPLAAETSAEVEADTDADADAASRVTSDSPPNGASGSAEGGDVSLGVTGTTSLASIPAIIQTGPSPSDSVDVAAPLHGTISPPLTRTSTSTSTTSASGNVNAGATALPSGTYVTPPRASRRSSVQIQADAMAATAAAAKADPSTSSIASSSGSQRKRHLKSGSAVEALARRFEQK